MRPQWPTLASRAVHEAYVEVQKAYVEVHKGYVEVYKSYVEVHKTHIEVHRTLATHLNPRNSSHVKYKDRPSSNTLD